MTPADFRPELTPESINHKRLRVAYGDSERGQSVAF